MKRLVIILLLAPLISFGQFYGLNRNYGDVPVVALTVANNYLAYCTFYAEGEVTSDGGLSVTDRGFVLSTSPNPTVSDIKLPYGTGTGFFSVSPVYLGLDASTTYYVRAYATNAKGTSYSPGSGISFTSYSLPAVSATASNITSASALIEGSANSNGNAVTGIRLEYGTSSGSYPNSQSVSFSTYYNIGLTSLSESTSYYYRVALQNSYCSWTYTAEQSFTTPASCTTNPAVTQVSFPGYPNSGRTSTSIDVSTAVNSDCNITSRKIHYSTTNNPPLESDPYFTQANITGTIASTVTGLSPNTGYYFACYAHNPYGSGYMAFPVKMYTLP